MKKGLKLEAHFAAFLESNCVDTCGVAGLETL